MKYIEGVAIFYYTYIQVNYMAGDIQSILFNIDTPSLIAVLFWGNLVAVLLVISYLLTSPSSVDRVLCRNYGLAKAFQAGAYLFMLLRGYVPDIFSVNLGNSVLFVGFFFEALSMLSLVGEKNRRNIGLMGVLTLIALGAFNSAEFLRPGDGSFRVFMASVCIFMLLCFPTIRMMVAKKKGAGKQVVAVFYLIFLCTLLPRALHAAIEPITVLSNTFLQTLTFLSMLLLLLFSPAAYLLLMRESMDKTLHTMATTDALTGLVNRHNFMPLAQRLYEDSRAKNSPLSLLFIDIDDFKVVNDSCGHSFGDTVLTRFAQLLKDTLRTVDVSCRYGGEEFVILLPRTDEMTAETVCARIMQKTAELSFAEYPDFGFTLSIGLSSIPPHGGESLADFINQADSAMYDAKHSGKNKLVIYSGEPDAPVCIPPRTAKIAV